MPKTNALAFAQQLDQEDPLAHFRKQFHIPVQNGKSVIYLCGNSLGLQPKATAALLKEELKQWQKHGVEGHFQGERPWKDYHHFLKSGLAHIVGAHSDEVTPMGSLTTNLHLLMVSFYKPTAQRFKIIVEKKAFPSDQYAFESQVRFHGFDPATAIIEVAPAKDAHTLTTADIEREIRKHGDSVALVLFGGVNYYTGQFFDLPSIVKAARGVGALVGFDLAHAAGNVPLQLHAWEVDFACWCGYKYLNGGPGGAAAIFVHRKHGNNATLPRFAGWWGHNEAARFEMAPGFDPMLGADGWQQSNAAIFSFAALLASLNLFEQATLPALRAKSQKLTGFLLELLQPFEKQGRLQIITPGDPNQRGCQLSLLTDNSGKALFDFLSAQHIIADWREPNVIRIAPVPLYNRFEEVHRFAKAIEIFFK